MTPPRKWTRRPRRGKLVRSDRVVKLLNYIGFCVEFGVGAAAAALVYTVNSPATDPRSTKEPEFSVAYDRSSRTGCGAIKTRFRRIRARNPTLRLPLSSIKTLESSLIF